MSSLLQGNSGRFTYTSLGGVVFFTFIYGLGYFLDPNIPTENLRTLLSVMIAAQASILAIVISVTLISTQLVANRYAPRMATLPFRTPLFQGAFLLFAISIILDVFLLIGITSLNSPLYSGGTFVAIGLFFGILLFLYYFIRGMVAHTSPENLVTIFTDTISVDEYLSRSQALAEAPAHNAHPLQPLYRFIMTALSQNEHGTARAALDQYQTYSSRIMTELAERDVFNDESIGCREELFGPVLTEHLHSITVHAANKDESQVLTSAISAQIELGKQGMEIEAGNFVPRQALRGIRYSIIESPVTVDDHATFNNAWPAVAELMLEETNYQQDRVLLSGKNLVNGRLTASLGKSNEPHWHTNALRQFFDDLCLAHIQVLDNIERGPGFDNIDLDRDPSLHEMPAPHLVKQAQYSRDAIFSATSTFLQFRIEKGFWPITVGNFRDQWRQICISAEMSGAEEHAISLCQALIEVAFHENANRPYEDSTSGSFGIDDNRKSDRLFWEKELTGLREEVSNPVVEQAFENILQYEYQEGPTPIRVLGEDSEVEDQFYFPELSLGDYRALNTYSQFPGLLKDLRQRVLYR